MSDRISLNVDIRDEAVFKATYPKMAEKVQQLAQGIEVDLSTFIFEECVVYEYDPYTFVIVYIGREDNEDTLIMSLEYLPDGSLISVSADLDRPSFDDLD